MTWRDIETALPCPFCGRKDLDIEFSSSFWVVCLDCGAEGPCTGTVGQAEQLGPEAVNLWNRRGAPPEVTTEAERISAMENK